MSCNLFRHEMINIFLFKNLVIKIHFAFINKCGKCANVHMHLYVTFIMSCQRCLEDATMILYCFKAVRCILFFSFAYLYPKIEHYPIFLCGIKTVLYVCTIKILQVIFKSVCRTKHFEGLLENYWIMILNYFF